MCVLHLLVYQPTHGKDLFVLQGCTHLLVVVYFSRYPEVIQLATTTSSKVTGALKYVFARHGIPEEVVSDNGLQFLEGVCLHSIDFTTLLVAHTTPQGDGHAEHAVQTVCTHVTHR